MNGAALGVAGELLIVDFGQTDFNDWEVSGKSFSSGPGRELLQDKQPVTGYLGRGYLHSNHGDRRSRES